MILPSVILVFLFKSILSIVPPGVFSCLVVCFRAGSSIPMNIIFCIIIIFSIYYIIYCPFFHSKVLQQNQFDRSRHGLLAAPVLVSQIGHQSGVPKQYVPPVYNTPWQGQMYEWVIRMGPLA